MSIVLDVLGFPPSRNEDLSIFSERHPHLPRVIRLLEAAKEATNVLGFEPMDGAIELEVTVYSPPYQPPWDAIKYLGGIAATLGDKENRGPLPHLGELREVAIYWSERQIERIRYRFVEAKRKHYRVKISQL